MKALKREVYEFFKDCFSSLNRVLKTTDHWFAQLSIGLLVF